MQPLEEVGEAWLRRAEAIITSSADALNTLNVFPVSDADTGTNLRLTLQGITRAVPSLVGAGLDTVVQAAVLSAHGNSGAILAEMVTSVCHALAERRAEPEPMPGALLATLARGVAAAATRAVSRPVHGTILTVADETAAGAERAALLRPDDALAVAVSAQQAARQALSQTREQLDVLARAGVVDAGAQAFVLLVDVLVEVLGGPTAQPLHEVVPPSGALATGVPADEEMPAARIEFEVMYALRGAPSTALDALRDRLSELGHSVVIVGDRSVAQVHVHLTEPGAAVEAGLGTGRLSQIRINLLPPPRPTPSRTVLAMVAGDGLAEAVRSFGVVPVERGERDVSLERLAAAVAETTGDLVILPNDPETLEMANHLADRWRAAGRRLAVIPTMAQVQGLAAIAVHEPSSDFDTAVVTMSAAAGHTRHGAVTVAESSAMTMAGLCRPGDVLGLVEGDFVEIGTSVTEVAWRVAERLLSAGGELLTLVRGAGAPAALVEELERRAHRAYAGVDVETLLGDQQRYPLLMGVE